MGITMKHYILQLIFRFTVECVKTVIKVDYIYITYNIVLSEQKTRNKDL